MLTIVCGGSFLFSEYYGLRFLNIHVYKLITAIILPNAPVLPTFTSGTSF